MKKVLFFLAFFLFATSQSLVFSQDAKQIGYVDSNEILDLMPERIEATRYLEELSNKYKEELKVMQNEYTTKYSDFISYQTAMAENIRLRRMQELHELEKNINVFIKLAQDDIENQEKELLIPLREKVKTAVYNVGVNRKLICVYDLANPNIIFVTPDAEDITQFVKDELNIK